jgi:transcriptional regulator with XRE-family HTH domain
VKTIGEQIKEARLKAGMTQLELSHKLGYDSMQFVSLFERNLSKVPLVVAGRCCVLLGMNLKKVIKQFQKESANYIVEQITAGAESEKVRGKKTNS